MTIQNNNEKTLKTIKENLIDLEQKIKGLTPNLISEIKDLIDLLEKFFNSIDYENLNQELKVLFSTLSNNFNEFKKTFEEIKNKLKEPEQELEIEIEIEIDNNLRQQSKNKLKR